MKKIYLAGPDVFEKDSIKIGKKYVELCKKYGFEGLYPLDNVIDFDQPKQKIAQDIFSANKKLIEKCDIVIANLNSFRGKESDSGTVWECGYAFGLKKEVYGYISKKRTYIEQFEEKEKKSIDNITYDMKNRTIEDFDLPLNLMISCSVKKIIVGDLEKVLREL
jgi:nucleoside 2-deoxyribosyltransferase